MPPKTKTPQPSTDLATKQQAWNTLYKTTLPSLAKSKDPAQPKWPVQLDHCFARIILDNAIGSGTGPWTDVLRSPAWRNMSVEQLDAAIELGSKVQNGTVDLVELDEASLRVRGKTSKAGKTQQGSSRRQLQKRTSDHHDDRAGMDGTKRPKRVDGDVSAYFRCDGGTRRHGTSGGDGGGSDNNDIGDGTKVEVDSTTSSPPEEPARDVAPPPQDPIETSKHAGATKHADEQTLDDLIESSSDLTRFRKRVLKLLCQVPKGRFTTYGAMASAITSFDVLHTERASDNEDNEPETGTGPRSGSRRIKSDGSQKTCCARAVGSAMRNNPFAPRVPCHRVLATGGKIGGFGGSWGEQGLHVREKRDLLRDEGVRFDGRGIVVGSPFTGFVDC